MKKYIFALSVILMLAGCGNSKYGGDSDSSSSVGTFSAPGVNAFANGFYGFAKSRGCVNCHGATQNPRFAVSDIHAAYAAARPLLNTTTPANSEFVTYAGNGHCGQSICSDPGVRPQVIGYMNSWAAAEGGGGGSTQYKTETLALPTTIPLITASANPAILRFALKDVKPGMAALTNARFEIEIQKLNEFEYRLNRPKIIGNASAITVTGIHVYLKRSSDAGIGAEDTSHGLLWTTISAAAPSYTTTPPANAPAGATPLSTMAIQMQILSPADSMTIGFDNLQ